MATGTHWELIFLTMLTVTTPTKWGSHAVMTEACQRRIVFRWSPICHLHYEKPWSAWPAIINAAAFLNTWGMYDWPLDCRLFRAITKARRKHLGLCRVLSRNMKWATSFSSYYPSLKGKGIIRLRDRISGLVEKYYMNMYKQDTARCKGMAHSCVDGHIKEPLSVFMNNIQAL